MPFETSINTDHLRTELAELTTISERFGSKLTKAFIDATVKGKDLNSVLKSLALSMSRMTLRQALRPVNEAVSGIVSNIINSPVKPFASGGVINTPTYFPMHGATGLAGEAGPEAILPLSRGSDGRLGIASASGQNISITFHVTATDAASFAQSESQISAMLNRAVSRGTRNL